MSPPLNVFLPAVKNRVALLALLMCRLAYAEQTFGIEEPLAHQMNVPAAILSELGSELNLRGDGCEQQTLAEALEATKITIGSKSSTLLVKPKQDAWCLCGAYLCPAWIFQLASNGASRLWATSGTVEISILNAKDRGYRRIHSKGGTAGHGFIEVWSWDGKNYVRSSRTEWMSRP